MTRRHQARKFKILTLTGFCELSKTVGSSHLMLVIFSSLDKKNTGGSKQFSMVGISVSRNISILLETSTESSTLLSSTQAKIEYSERISITQKSKLISDTRNSSLVVQ